MGENIIRPHEKIFAAAKEDRQNLLKTLKVNTSPVLMMYRDPQRIIAETLAAENAKGTCHRRDHPRRRPPQVWAIINKAVINRIAYALGTAAFLRRQRLTTAIPAR